MISHKFPWYSFESGLQVLYRKLVFERSLKSLGPTSFVSPFIEIMNMRNVAIGDNVYVSRGSVILAIDHYDVGVFSPSITIDDGAYLGKGVTLACAKELVVGENAVLGDNVYIADCSHSLQDIRKSVVRQELEVGVVKIGSRSWIGKNSVVLFDLTIGENAVVGANSFVNRSVPPYTMVCGSPAKIVKRYDLAEKRWVAARD